MKRTLPIRQFLLDNIHFVFGVTLCLVAFLAALYTESQDLEIRQLTYSDQPLAISIPVGVPIEMRFPEPVEFGIPNNLREQVHIENVASAVYLTANVPFNDAIVVVKLLHSGAPIVLRLSSSTGATGPNTYSIGVSFKEAQKTDTLVQSPVALTRFAAQQLFAPERLVPHLNNVIRVDMDGEPINLARDPDIESKVLASWSSGSLYVTAVKLTNLSQVSVDLKPHDLRGSWQTATYHHHRLLPKGTKGDTSVVYLVSTESFLTALSN